MWTVVLCTAPSHVNFGRRSYGGLLSAAWRTKAISQKRSSARATQESVRRRSEWLGVRRSCPGQRRSKSRKSRAWATSKTSLTILQNSSPCFASFVPHGHICASPKRNFLISCDQSAGSKRVIGKKRRSKKCSV